ncbi:MAG TPA: hypothetical protein VKA37_01365, partial [Halobacteriales archaeon]|nr:hypothetical protein [Halobacteriales archaeon]
MSDGRLVPGMTEAAFTDELRPTAEPIWEAIVEHPMVSGLGDGTLDEAPFRYWVRQ